MNETFFCTRCSSYGNRGSERFPLCLCPKEYLLCTLCQDVPEEKPFSLHKCFHNLSNNPGYKTNRITRCIVCHQYFSEEKLADHLEQAKKNKFFYCMECCIYYEEKCNPVCCYPRQVCAFCLQILTDVQGEYHKCFHENNTEDFETLKETNAVKCYLCNYSYHKNFGHRHRRMHNYVRCDICCISVYVPNLPHHVAKTHLACVECGFRFEDFIEYEPHKKSHKSKKIATVCEICGKKVVNLNQHLKDVHGDQDKFKCSVCDKKFMARSGLQKHKLVHSDSNNYLCTICGKGTKFGYSMRIHMRTHDEVKPFECLVCLKTFTTKQWRDNHTKTHK